MKEVPRHYAGTKDVIENIQNRRGMDAAIHFCFDNIHKYATRMTRKGQLRDDITKIEIYAGRVIDIVVDAKPRLNELATKIVRTETISENLKYLEGQFGTKFVLDYIQGRIIELVSTTPHLGDSESKYEKDIYIATMSIILSSHYVMFLNNLSDEEEVEEEVEEEDILDPYIKTTAENIEIIANDIANAFKDIFKHK